MAVFKSAFSEEFDELTLADLIEDIEIRDLIKEAEKALEENRFPDSIIASAKAFQKALLSEIGRRPYIHRPSHFIDSDVEDIGRRLGVPNAFRDLGKHLRNFREWIEHLEEQLKVIALGCDLRQYLRFRQKSPHIVVVIGGEMQVLTRQNWQPTKDDCIEVLDFVFSTILRWQSTPLEEEH